MSEYEMSQQQLDRLLDACKPVLAIMLQCGPLPSPQQNANDAWARLGVEMEFDSMSVRPVYGKGDRFFTADPTAVLAENQQ